MVTTPDTIKAVEALLMFPFLVLGLSHIAQPIMWHDLFTKIINEGHPGAIKRTFLFDLWPAIIIITFHQDWSWPGVVLTTYGCALALKSAIGILGPNVGMRSLSMVARTGEGVFAPAGLMLCSLGLFCAARLLGFWT